MTAVGPILTESQEDNLAGAPKDDTTLPAPVVNPPVDETMVGLLVSNKRSEQLWDRCERAQTAINQTVNNISLASNLLQQLQQARNFMLAGKDHFDDADLVLGKVEHRIEFNKRMVKISSVYAPRLLIYELVWLIALGSGVLILNLNGFLASLSIIPNPGLVDAGQLVNSLFWGGLGGVVGALYALWKHVADNQDFDPQFSIWYITNPILGVALGAFIFLVIQAGFLSLTAGATASASIRSASVIYVLAWVAGFKQNVVYEIVRRILDVFSVNSSSQSVGTPISPAPPGSSSQSPK